MTRAMRRMRKYLIVVACIALVLGVAIGGTVAWLADSSEQVVNTFDPKNLDVTLTEGVDRAFDIIPGTEETKQPTVTVVKAELDSYVFVKVTETNMGDSGLVFTDYVSYSVDSANWQLADVEGLAAYEKVYYKEVPAGATNVTLDVLAGDKVTYSEDITKTDMDALETAFPNGLSLTFKAYMIQKAGMNDNPATAWNTAVAQNYNSTTGANQ